MSRADEPAGGPWGSGAANSGWRSAARQNLRPQAVDALPPTGNQRWGYSLKGALVRGAMQPAGGVPHVRGWLKARARKQGRGAEVDAIEAWEQQQRQAVARQLGLMPGAAQQLLELPLDKDH